MANKEQLAILRQGVAVWNKWRQENFTIQADLSEADLSRTDLSEAILKDADLSEADLSEANLSQADLRGADLMEADFSEALLIRANFSGAHLIGTNLSRANFSGARLDWANLSAATLREADLRGVNLSDADLRGAELILANLRGANLSQADLRKANLSGANLSQADLIGVELSGANLSGAFLKDADLSEANLIGADLIGAKLNGAILIKVDLSRAKLSGADLTNAVVTGTIFADIDLGSVQGLETVEHYGPSTIGTDTLFNSGDKIPEKFLRGCGVHVGLIEYLPSLIGAMQPIQFYSCFISYSTKDEAFARRLYADLQSNNVRCWFAPEDLKIGDRIRTGIDEAIQVHDKLLLVLSKTSVESDWVEKEVETAMEKERRQKRTVLFPVRLDNAAMEIHTGWPADIRRSRNIGDFHRWKNHDAYQKAFARLLRDLQSTKVPLPSTPVIAPQARIVSPSSAQTQVQKLIATKTRRLQHLEQKQAFKGVNTSVEVLMELEDLRREVVELNQRFADEASTEP